MNEEVPRGLIKDGPAENLFPSGGGDEFLVEQGFDDAGGMNAADLLNFGNCHGLLVCNYGKGFERGQGKTRRRNLALDELLQDFMVLGLGGKTESICDFANFNAVLSSPVLLHEFQQRLVDLASMDFGQRLINGIETDRLFG